jgi:hypothetical protein
MSEELKGSLLRGADGSTYFIREETLEACKIDEPELIAMCDELVGGDVDGFAANFEEIKLVPAVRIPSPLARGLLFKGAHFGTGIRMPGGSIPDE